MHTKTPTFLLGRKKTLQWSSPCSWIASCPCSQNNPCPSCAAPQIKMEDVKSLSKKNQPNKHFTERKKPKSFWKLPRDVLPWLQPCSGDSRNVPHRTHCSPALWWETPMWEKRPLTTNWHSERGHSAAMLLTPSQLPIAQLLFFFFFFYGWWCPFICREQTCHTRNGSISRFYSSSNGIVHWGCYHILHRELCSRVVDRTGKKTKVPQC